MKGVWFIQGTRPAWRSWKHTGWQSVVEEGAGEAYQEGGCWSYELSETIHSF